MSVHTLLNCLKRESAGENTRLERLLAAELTAAGGSLEPFVFHPRPADVQLPSDRRSEPRFPIDNECEVSVILTQHAEPLRGMVRDVSRSGLGIVLPCALATGAEVMVRLGSMLMFGQVAFASGENGGGGAGIYTGVALRHVFELRREEESADTEQLLREL
jgi:hypothetical protein